MATLTRTFVKKTKRLHVHFQILAKVGSEGKSWKEAFLSTLPARKGAVGIENDGNDDGDGDDDNGDDNGDVSDAEDVEEQGGSAKSDSSENKSTGNGA